MTEPRVLVKAAKETRIWYTGHGNGARYWINWVTVKVVPTIFDIFYQEKVVPGCAGHTLFPLKVTASIFTLEKTYQNSNNIAYASQVAECWRMDNNTSVSSEDTFSCAHVQLFRYVNDERAKSPPVLFSTTTIIADIHCQCFHTSLHDSVIDRELFSTTPWSNNR